ncbi:MAG: c-type cytochrome domain-containing protein, partial [Planctomycetota bacterium]
RNRTQPIHNALIAEKLEAAHWFIDHGVDLTGHASAGKVPAFLFSAYADSPDTSIAQAFLSRDIDKSATNERGETALTWARRRGHGGLIDLLSKAGVPESPDKVPEIPNRKLDLNSGNRDELIRAAINGSVALMQKSSDKFLDERKNCVSCHHQHLPGAALGLVRDRGFRVDQKSIDRMLRRHAKDWGKRIARAHESVHSVPVAPRFLGWGLWEFSALGYPQDLITDSFVRRLALSQRPDGRWTTGMKRPPMGGGDILSTALVLRALRDYPIRGHEEELNDRIGHAARWLRSTRPAHHQERVFRLFGLTWAGVPAATLEVDAKALLAEQRDDGGWAQLPELSSDAWASGQALVALRTSGLLAPADPAYRRGIEFLLRTRFDDGAWFAQSRTWPFQTHFESDFPFGHDQWLSIGATAWAVMALALGVDSQKSTVVRSRSETKLPEREMPTAAAKAVPTPAKPKKREETRKLKIDFRHDIAPVLSRSCAACHSGGKPKGGFLVTDRNSFIQGGESGDPAIRVGESTASQLIQLIGGGRSDLEMPPRKARKKYPALSDEEVAKIRAWIDQGAKWPEGATVDLPEAKKSKKL